MSGQGLGLDWVTRVATSVFTCLDKVPLTMCCDRGLCGDGMWSRPEGLVSRYRNYVVIGRHNERSSTHALQARVRVRVHGKDPHAIEGLRAGTRRDCRDREFSVTIELISSKKKKEVQNFNPGIWSVTTTINYLYQKVMFSKFKCKRLCPHA